MIDNLIITSLRQLIADARDCLAARDAQDRARRNVSLGLLAFGLALLLFTSLLGHIALPGPTATKREQTGSFDLLTGKQWEELRRQQRPIE